MVARLGEPLTGAEGGVLSMVTVRVITLGAGVGVVAGVGVAVGVWVVVGVGVGVVCATTIAGFLAGVGLGVGAASICTVRTAELSLGPEIVMV